MHSNKPNDIINYFSTVQHKNYRAKMFDSVLKKLILEKNIENNPFLMICSLNVGPRETFLFDVGDIQDIRAGPIFTNQKFHERMEMSFSTHSLYDMMTVVDWISPKTTNQTDSTVTHVFVLIPFDINDNKFITKQFSSQILFKYIKTVGNINRTKIKRLLEDNTDGRVLWKKFDDHDEYVYPTLPGMMRGVFYPFDKIFKQNFVLVMYTDLESNRDEHTEIVSTRPIQKTITKYSSNSTKNMFKLEWNNTIKELTGTSEKGIPTYKQTYTASIIKRLIRSLSILYKRYFETLVIDENTLQNELSCELEMAFGSEIIENKRNIITKLISYFTINYVTTIYPFQSTEGIQCISLQIENVYNLPFSDKSIEMPISLRTFTISDRLDDLLSKTKKILIDRLYDKDQQIDSISKAIILLATD